MSRSGRRTRGTIDVEDNGMLPASVDPAINARWKFNLSLEFRSSVTILVYQMSDYNDKFLLRFLLRSLFRVFLFF